MNVRKILAVLALFSLLSTATGGYLFYRTARDAAAREAEGELVAKTQLVKDRIERLISGDIMAVRTLALFEELQAALLNTNPDTVSRANRILDHFVEGLSEDVCYLVDRTGNTIASSNRHNPDSFVGNNYSFRPYFHEALAGKPIIYLALGKTSGVRGIYSSHPVYQAGNDDPVGVVVIKAPANDLESALSKVNGGIWLLVHKSGLIFLSTKPDWLLHFLWQPTPEESSRIEETKQFGKGPWNWTGLKKKTDNQVVDRAGQTYVVEESDVESCPGWRLVYLFNSESMSRKLVDPLVGLTRYLALVLCVLVFVAVIVLYKMGRDDLSSRKLAENALRQSENKLRAIVEHSTNLFYSHGINHKLTYLSPQTRQFIDCEPEEGLVRWTEFATDNPINLCGVESTQKAIDTGQRQPPYLLELQGKKGRKILVEVNESPVVVDGKTEAIVGSLTDVTERRISEEALRLSEQRYRALFEAAADAIYVLDAEGERAGQIVSANSAAAEMHGYTVDEILTLKISDLDAPESAAKAPERFQRILRGEVVREEVTHRKKDGTVFPLEINARLLELDGRKLALAVDRNITERKRAEEALRKSENRFQQLMEHSPMAMAVTDMNGEVEYLNKKFIELFGYTIEDIPTLEHWWHLAYPDPQIAERVRSEWLSATREAGEKGSEAEPKERAVRRKDGTILIIDFRKTVIDRWVIHTFHDVTESKRQKEALRESEQMFRLLSEQSLMSVAILQDGVYKYTNQAMSDLCEYSAEEIAAWGPEEFLAVAHPEDRSLVMEQARMKQAGDPRQKTNYSFRIITKSGQTKWVEIYSKTIQFQDRSANLLTMIDITGRKQAEERLLQSQKMEAIGTLAGGIAHDVNNLLQIVLGHADMLLLREGMDEKSSRSMEAIRRAARNGADLVSRILTFSRKSEPEMRAINVSEEVRRVDELLRRTIPRMISLEMSLEDNLRMINGDPSQIEQILLNLAANARDAMPEGGRLVFETSNATIREEYCRTHPEVKPGKYVLLTVSDTGQGMARGILDRIFEPFFTTKQPGEGTGLGLSMVFGVVKSHGGHITCYSEAGVGSTFKIYFPVLEEGLQPEQATTIEMPAGGTETILLVDDEDAVRTLGAEMLELAGYTVLTAANGREALEVFRNNRESIALVILDLVMPEMSGRRCLEELLKMNPRAKVLIASGYAANGPAKEARESGAAGFVSKPFDLKQFLMAIRRILG
ncbi:MAG: PAS domain S-box protein [Desulfomonile tiedjei]|nr:PAS domain S-box protein [Desulfomonile tiedjei]